MRSCGWLILKFSRDRSVCAPQYLSAGTSTSPNASVSALVSAIADGVAWKYLPKRGCVEVEEAMLESFWVEDIIDEEGRKRLGLEIDLDAAVEAANDLLWKARDGAHEGAYKVVVVKAEALALGTCSVAPDRAPLPDRSIVVVSE